MIQAGSFRGYVRSGGQSFVQIDKHGFAEGRAGILLPSIAGNSMVSALHKGIKRRGLTQSLVDIVSNREQGRRASVNLYHNCESENDMKLKKTTYKNTRFRHTYLPNTQYAPSFLLICRNKPLNCCSGTYPWRNDD